MLFLKKKWNSSVNALLLIFMVMLGLYLFDDNIGLFSTLSALFGSAEMQFAIQICRKWIGHGSWDCSAECFSAAFADR